MMEIQIEFNQNMPMYMQIIEQIKKMIDGGELHPGEKLPTVRDLSNACG
jgi:GntR family transcriptional regulator